MSSCWYLRDDISSDIFISLHCHLKKSLYCLLKHKPTNVGQFALEGQLSVPCHLGSFPFVPPSLVGAYYLHPQTNVPYFYIMNYYVMTRAVTGTGGGGYITYWGEGTNENPSFVML